jgi:inositol phosphorylceramide synthase catalytic subunit
VIRRLWQHMRSLWPRYTLLPPLPFLIYGAVMVSIGNLRWDHAVMMFVLPFLAYFNAQTKKLFTGGYAIAFTALLYDGMRYVRNVGVSVDRVHVCDLRDIELRFFGMTGPGGERITVQDWFTTHHATWLDLYCAIPYGTFIFACLGCAIVLWGRDYRAVQRFAWGFFLMNVVAFATYHLYPAAPPWYYHAHGCVVDMAANPQAGPRLEHVDAVLGIDYFHGMYARSSDIYGAVPSLHVAYPMLILLEGWRLFRWPGRAFSIVFFLSMGFAAVYLDHHWIVDVVLGMLYCTGAWALIHFVASRWGKAQVDPSAVAAPVAEA